MSVIPEAARGLFLHNKSVHSGGMDAVLLCPGAAGQGGNLTSIQPVRAALRCSLVS